MIDDESIDYSDIPETDEEFWKNARFVKGVPRKSMNLQVDEDILSFFKDKNLHYQVEINNILRQYISSQENLSIHQ